MNPEEHVDRLRELAQEQGETVVKVSEAVFSNPRFSMWPGSVGNGSHHGYVGGLAQHTYEVVTLCLRNKREMNLEANEAILFMSALFHDVGKMWDYDYDESSDKWVADDHKRLVHHISRSGIEWMTASNGVFHEGIRSKVLHCILSHHGRREWGSPVAPKTQEAWLLHICDQMSARMNDWKTNDVINRDRQ